MLTVVLFNKINDSGADLFRRFDRVRKLFWGLLLVYFAYDLLSAELIQLNAFRAGGLLLCIGGLVFPQKRIQNLLVLVGYLTMITYLYMDYQSPYSLAVNDSGYSKVEHLTIFLSFVYGFVVTEFLKGWSRIMNDYKRIKISFVHLLWTLFTFLLLLDIWWGNWVLKSFIDQNQLYYLLLMTKPFLLYMLTLYLIPRPSEEIVDYWEYFRVYQRFIFPVFAMVLFGNMLISIFFNLFEVEILQNFLRAGGILVAFLAWKSRQPWVHYLLLAVSLGMVVTDFLVKSGVIALSL